MSDLQIDSVILTGAAVAASLFPVLYWVIAPWYRSEYGRASWTMMLAIAVLLDVALVAYWFGWTVPEWLARCIYVLILVGCWMKLGALVDQQLRIPWRRRRDR